VLKLFSNWTFNLAVLSSEAVEFEMTLPLVIIGAGACGLTAALAAYDEGIEALVIERDSVPQGSTALSSGMIPACGTAQQKALGVEDSVALMSQDILSKCHGETDHAMVKNLCAQSGATIDWLCEKHNIGLTLVEGFLYPNHSQLRMHAPKSRQGTDLVGSLRQAVEAVGVDIFIDAVVTDLFADDNNRVHGLSLTRPDGSTSKLGCQTLILACNGFGGNQQMMQRLIPQMAGGNYFGHMGNQGDAILWGEALGAQMADLGAFQGHGSVAHPHGILISWALMMEGGIQVNVDAQRFSNEHQGYSEQGRRVLRQPEATVWCIYDTRLHQLGGDFEDYRLAEKGGAVRTAPSIEALAELCDLNSANLAKTLAATQTFAAGASADPFGRDFTTKPALVAPYFAVKVTGSLFHTQGGLVVDDKARVMSQKGKALANLYAGGGAARGLSGPSDWGYLSGNGLLTAVVLGRIAGRSAANQIKC
tara:strand:+ start:463 stop:1893 length:1431 start_codon:yes stop_codon:yes gene_type:complete